MRLEIPISISTSEHTYSRRGSTENRSLTALLPTFSTCANLVCVMFFIFSDCAANKIAPAATAAGRRPVAM